MTTAVDSHANEVATADPRHRSFHMTRPVHLAEEASPADIASGWVRIIGSDGRPIAIRIASITKVVGPYTIEGHWVVELTGRKERLEPIGFVSEADAEHFVEDLLHDD